MPVICCYHMYMPKLEKLDGWKVIKYQMGETNKYE